MYPSNEISFSHIDTPDGPLVPPTHIKRLIDHIVNADRRYFIAHPGVTRRDRAYVPGEAWPLEPGDVNRCTVIRLSASKQARCYYRADEGDA